eukprot:TRINITY_DN9032_c0_g1_i1.p1 TRINITY_DN9032_c0_g1~~TRINITY_DN9032_c0_g1_i1.p1  ORF type:complete len:150 (+),score=30.14 TRINITY_DN9032_c0_g1_i1:396-845(+)
MTAREIATDSCPKDQYTTQCVFVMRELPHKLFAREGDNLIHTHSLPLVQSLTGSLVNIQSLEGHQLSIGVNQVVHNNTTHTLPGQGMPNEADPSVRGDLIVKFNTVFPQQLNDTQRQLIKAALYLPTEDKLDAAQQSALRAMRCAFQFN